MTTARWVPRPTHERQLPHHVAWYLAAGVVTTGLQEVFFLAARPTLGSVAANVLAIALTTIANTEFHRRVTFAGTPHSATRLHLQSVLTFVLYAGYGSIVLLSLHAFTDTPSAVLEATMLAIASGIVGIGRFALLRWWVFAKRH